LQKHTDMMNLQDSSLRFWEEDMIRRDMAKIEKLIRLLDSNDFNLEFNVGHKWFDDATNNFKDECKSFLKDCGIRLANSPNYQ